MLQNIGIEKAWTWYAIHSTQRRNKNEKETPEIKTLSAKNDCNGVSFGVVTKFKFRYLISNFSWFDSIS